jgi:hypothetical protein
MKATGKLVEIFKTVQITDKFQKREFVLEYAPNPKYPELVKFEIVQDKCALLDDFKVGDAVEVDFDLRGRKWTDKQGEVRYFTTVQAWRVSSAEGGASKASAKPAAGGSDEDTTDYGGGKESEDPF